MKKKSRHEQRYGLHSIRVTGMTYHHLCCMAEAQHLKSPGEAVDKIMRIIRATAHMKPDRREHGDADPRD